MNVDGFAYRWRAALLLIAFALVTCTVLAEEGVLVLVVMDTEQHPFANVRIGTAGDAGSPQFTDQNGKARLRLALNTKPAAWVTLQLMGAPNGLDLAFISPYDGRIRVPPFDNEQDNYDPVVLAKHADKSILESGSGMLAIHANVNHSVAAQKKKAPAHTSRNNSNYPSPFDYGTPRLHTVALNMATPPAHSPVAPPTRAESREAAIAAAAQKFGLSVAEVKAAMESWGGDPLVWKSILLTATLENGGADPFPAIHAYSGNIVFGIAIWSLDTCRLQPLLLKFQQRDEKRFAEIVGTDTEWLSNTLSQPCQVSSEAILKRMLDESGHLQPAWRDRFRRLGYEHEFQREQVNAVMPWMRAAQQAVSSLGLRSEQSLAFCYDFAEIFGEHAFTREFPRLLPEFSQSVAAFKQQLGREPDEQERLLVLANHAIRSEKKGRVHQIGMDKLLIARATLLSEGQGVVSGTHYDLQDFGIGMQDAQSGADIPLHNDPTILQQLQDGWIPSEGPPPGSASLSGKPTQGGTDASKTPASPPPASPVLSTVGAPKPNPDGTPGLGNTPHASQPGPLYPSVEEPPAPFDPAAEKQFVELINRERTKQGLAPLVVDPRLTQAARQHTELLVAHKTLSHQFEGEPSLDGRFSDVNLPSDEEGENTALDKNVPSAHQGFMNDPEHHDNILDPKYNVVGVGVIRSGGQVYVTEDFAHLPN